MTATTADEPITTTSELTIPQPCHAAPQRPRLIVMIIDDAHQDTFEHPVMMSLIKDTQARLLCRLLDGMTGEQVLSCSDTAAPGGMVAFAILLFREFQNDHPELVFAAGDDGQAMDMKGS